jgi:hypothetical protein
LMNSPPLSVSKPRSGKGIVVRSRSRASTTSDPLAHGQRHALRPPGRDVREDQGVAKLPAVF